MKYILLLFIIIFALSSCKNDPKAIQANSNTQQTETRSSTGVFDNKVKTSIPAEGINVENSQEVNVIKAIETLYTDKYVYIKGTQGNDTLWVASSKQDIIIGDNYFYKSGLRKVNFESKEFNRTFDEIFLVSSLVHSKHAQDHNQNDNLNQKSENKTKPLKSSQVGNVSTTPLKSIISNPAKFEGQTIRVAGNCTKMNPNIMGRNWIHIKDGSADDYDFVATSSSMVRQGQDIILQGVLNLNRDFGAGYTYEMIMENAEIIE